MHSVGGKLRKTRQPQRTLPGLHHPMPLLLPHPIQHLQPVPIPGGHLPVNHRQMQVVGIPSRVDGPSPEILPGQERPAVQRLVPQLIEDLSRHSMRGKRSNTGSPNRSKPVPSMEISHKKYTQPGTPGSIGGQGQFKDRVLISRHPAGLQKAKHRQVILALHTTMELQRMRLGQALHTRLSSRAQMLHKPNNRGLRLFIMVPTEARTHPQALVSILVCRQPVF